MPHKHVKETEKMRVRWAKGGNALARGTNGNVNESGDWIGLPPAQDSLSSQYNLK